MANQQAPRDGNFVPTLLLVDDTTGETVAAKCDSNGNLLIAATITGGITGPGSSTDNAVVRWDGTGGTTVQNSTVVIGDTGAITGVLSLTGVSGGITVTGGTGSGDDLTLVSTSNATKGYVILGSTAGVVFDQVNNRVGIGIDGTDNTVTISGVSYGSTLSVHAEGASDGAEFSVHRHSDIAGFGSHFVAVRSRGTEASETVVQSGDVLSRIDSLGFDGTDYEIAAQIDVEVDGTPGSGDMPGRIVFKTTPDGSATPAEAFRIKNDGNTQFVAGKAIQTAQSAGNTLLFQGYNTGGASYTTLMTITANATPTIALVTPDIGVATATSVNKVTITAPASSATLTIADGKTLTQNKSMTLTAADDTGIYTFPTGTKTLVATDVTTLSSLVSVGTITTGVWNGTDIAVADGGTGVSSLTAYAVLCGGTTSTGAVQSVASVGTTGQVLTSNGAGALPTFQDASAGGTARRNLNILLTIAQTLQYGTTPTVTDNLNGIVCAPAASSAARSVIAINGTNVANLDFYDKDPEINITSHYAVGSGTADGRVYFGDIGSSDPGDGNNPTNTVTAKSMYVVGITSSGTTTFYAVNASGTTNTNTSLTGITASDANNWRIVKNSTTNIKYYCNYTLKATHTTNLPSGDNTAADAIFLAGAGNNTGDTTSRGHRIGFLDILLNSPTG